MGWVLRWVGFHLGFGLPWVVLPRVGFYLGLGVTLGWVLFGLILPWAGFYLGLSFTQVLPWVRVSLVGISHVVGFYLRFGFNFWVWFSLGDFALGGFTLGWGLVCVRFTLGLVFLGVWFALGWV